MKNRPNLSVRPVHKSKKPGYPSWQEPNPLAQPHAQPYPFTQKAINWLAASGLCGALFLMPEAEGGVAKQVVKTESIDRDTLGNPFPYDRMGVPYRTVSFGTGLPQRISEKEARAVIDSVFRAHGFHLEKTVVQAADGLVELDGYDASQHVGYVWIGWNRMGEDMAIPWREDKSKSSKPVRSADSRLDGYGRSIKKIHEQLSKHKSPTESQIRFLQKLKTLLDAGQPDWKPEYKYLFYEYMLDNKLENYAYRPKQHHPEFIKYAQGILSMEAGAKQNKQLDTAMDVLDHLKIHKDWVSKPLIEAATGRRAKLKLKRLRTLQDAYNAFSNSDSAKAEQIKQLIIAGKQGWKPAVIQVEEWLDERTINLHEAWALEAKAHENNQFVALISSMDDRMVYSRTRKEVEQQLEESWFFHKQRNPNADSLDFAAKYKIEQQLNSPLVKENVLKELERQVVNYIRWAKHQQGY